MAAIQQQPSTPTIFFDAISDDHETIDINIDEYEMYDLPEEEDPDITEVNPFFDAMPPRLQEVVSSEFDSDPRTLPLWILKYFQCFYNQRGTNKIHRVMESIEEVISYGEIDVDLATAMVDVLEEIFIENDIDNIETINDLLADYREVMLCYPKEFKDKSCEFKEFMKSKI